MFKLHYRIRRPLEEGYCDNCAAPMQVGDDGIEGERGAYCCAACWEDGESHNDSLTALVGAGNDYPE